jgi:translation initiation factor IF-1
MCTWTKQSQRQTNQENQMTKSQTKAVENLKIHAKLGNDHAVAAGLSALIRSAMRPSDKVELYAIANQLKVDQHEAFIV